MVCIADDGQAAALIRTAKRSAERRQVPWLALYIESHRHAALPESVKRDVTQTLHLAESLGGETVTVASEDVAGEILRVARERNVSVIIIGKSRRPLHSRLMRPSVAAAVLDRGDSFDIMVMSGSEVRRRPPSSPAPHPGAWFRRVDWLSYGWATATILMTTVIAGGASHIAGLAGAHLNLFDRQC